MFQRSLILVGCVTHSVVVKSIITKDIIVERRLEPLFALQISSTRKTLRQSKREKNALR